MQNHSTPEYFSHVQKDLERMIEIGDRAANRLVNGDEYANRTHPNHGPAVYTFNRLQTALLILEDLIKNPPT